MANSYLKKINEKSLGEQLDLWQKIYNMLKRWGEWPLPLPRSKAYLAEKAERKMQELKVKLKEADKNVRNL